MSGESLARNLKRLMSKTTATRYELQTFDLPKK